MVGTGPSINIPIELELLPAPLRVVEKTLQQTIRDIDAKVNINTTQVRTASGRLERFNQINTRSGIIFERNGRILNQTTRTVNNYRGALNRGTTAARGFAEAAADAANRLLLWTIPARVLFSVISGLQEAGGQLVRLDTQFRRLAFFDPKTFERIAESVSETGDVLQTFLSRSFNIAAKEANRLGVSLSEVTDVIVTVGRVGRETIDIINGQASSFVQAVTSLLALERGALSAERATTGLNAILNQFQDTLGGTAEAAGEFSGLIAARLAGAAKESAFSVQQLIDALTRTGAAFQSIAGVNTQEAITLLEEAADITGATPERVATLFRQLLTLLPKNAEKIREITSGLGEFGKEIEIVNKNTGEINFEGFLEFLGALKGARGTQLSVLLAGQGVDRRNLAAAQAFAGATDRIRDSLKQLQDPAVASAKAAEDVRALFEQEKRAAEGLEGSINTLSNSFTQLLQSAAFVEIATGVVKFANDTVNAISGVVEFLSKFGAQIKFVGKLFAITFGASALRGAVTFFSRLKGLITGEIVSRGASIQAINAETVAINNATVAQKGLNAAAAQEATVRGNVVAEQATSRLIKPISGRAFAGLALGGIVATSLTGPLVEAFNPGGEANTAIADGVNGAIQGGIAGLAIGGPLGGLFGAIIGGGLSALSSNADAQKAQKDADELIRRQEKAAELARKEIEFQAELRRKVAGEQSDAQEALLDINDKIAFKEQEIAQAGSDFIEKRRLGNELVKLTLRRKEAEAKLGSDERLREERLLNLQKEQLTISNNVLEIERRRAKELARIEDLRAIETTFATRADALEIGFKFDEQELVAQINAIRDRARQESDLLVRQREAEDTPANIRKSLQSLGKLEVQTFELQAKLGRLRLSQSKEAVSFATEAANKQITAWRNASQAIADAFEGISQAQFAVANAFGDVIRANIEIAKKDIEIAIEQAKGAGGDIDSIISETARRSATLFRAAGENFAKERDNLRQELAASGISIFTNPQQIDAAIKEIAAIALKNAKAVDKEVIGAESARANRQLALDRQRQESEEAIFKLRLNATKQEIELQQDARQEQIEILRDAARQQKELFEERKKQQTNLGKLILEGPEAFLDAAQALNTVEQFFKGIDNLDAEGLGEIIRRSQGLRGAGLDAILQRVTRGLEIAAETGIGLGDFNPEELLGAFIRAQIPGQDADKLAEILTQERQARQNQLEFEQAARALQIEQAKDTKSLARITQQEAAFAKTKLTVAETQRDKIIDLLSGAFERQDSALQELIRAQKDAQISSLEALRGQRELEKSSTELRASNIRDENRLIKEDIDARLKGIRESKEQRSELQQQIPLLTNLLQNIGARQGDGVALGGAITPQDVSAISDFTGISREDLANALTTDRSSIARTSAALSITNEELQAAVEKAISQGTPLENVFGGLDIGVTAEELESAFRAEEILKLLKENLNTLNEQLNKTLSPDDIKRSTEAIEKLLSQQSDNVNQLKILEDRINKLNDQNIKDSRDIFRRLDELIASGFSGREAGTGNAALDALREAGEGILNRLIPGAQDLFDFAATGRGGLGVALEGTRSVVSSQEAGELLAANPERLSQLISKFALAFQGKEDALDELSDFISLFEGGKIGIDTLRAGVQQVVGPVAGGDEKILELAVAIDRLAERLERGNLGSDANFRDIATLLGQEIERALSRGQRTGRREIEELDRIIDGTNLANAVSDFKEVTEKLNDFVVAGAQGESVTAGGIISEQVSKSVAEAISKTPLNISFADLNIRVAGEVVNTLRGEDFINDLKASLEATQIPAQVVENILALVRVQVGEIRTALAERGIVDVDIGGG
jgi:molybdopterin biosynthesis enzyme MoaB